MEIKIVVDAPKGWKRRVLLYVVTPVALVAATALIARAMVLPVDAGWIEAGAPVSASDLASDFSAVNTNFGTLDQRVGVLEDASAGNVRTAVLNTSSTGCGPSGGTLPSWIASCLRNSAGNYTINFAAGAFSQAPVCVVSTNSLLTGFCNPGTSSTSLDLLCGSNGAYGDGNGVFVVCVGP